MKIGIDISQLVYQGSGVAKYTESLVKWLVKAGEKEEFFFFGSSLRNQKLLRDYLRGLSAKNIKPRLTFLPPKILEFLWNGVHLFAIENLIGKVDVFHTSDWLEPPAAVNKVTTIHDLAIFKYPETFSPRGGHDIVANQKRKLHFVKQDNDFVIAVSETTKNDIQEILKIPEKRIKVIYEAADPFYSVRDVGKVRDVKEKYGIKGEYFLCVGTREPRKNLDRALMAFSEIAGAQENLSLVIVGKYGWGEDSAKCKVPLQGKQSAKLEDRAKVLGLVEKEELACLYSGAKAFVYPSLYEGFGLPILEAMSCGCPVITSNIGSMKEIAGDAALFFDPEKPEEIAEAMSKVSRNDKTRENLILQGFKRAGEFSWEKTALQTLEVYHSLV
ncbi:MAG: glycosyltransferase family 4 protein [Patescibacteria group bacterium]|nr:glycosyltransferase family 4 protein [Patescibacteria group bacterium]